MREVIIMLKSLIGKMCCPICKSKLLWNIHLENKNRIVHADIHCDSCNVTFSVRDTIGIFLVPDKNGYIENDNFQQQNDILSALPSDVIESLLHANPYELNESDLTFLSEVYLSQNKVRQSAKIKMLARKKKYSEEYNQEIKKQLKSLQCMVKWDTQTVLDIATGRGTLLKLLLSSNPKNIVGSDISLKPLQGLKRELEIAQRYTNTSLLVMNAKMIPFSDNSFDIITSFHGINHIQNTADLLSESMRVSKRFLSLDNIGTERNRKFYDNGIKHTENTITEIANRLHYNILFHNKKNVWVTPTEPGDIVPLSVNTYPHEPCNVINCIIDVWEKSSKEIQSREMLKWKYKDRTVFYYPELNGDGINQAHSFVKFIKSTYSQEMKFKRVFEWCSGPGFIGFSLLFEGICEELCLADINPSAISCVQETIRYNKLESKVAYYVSDNFQNIPCHEKFDLVVSNPPNYYSLNVAHHDYEWLQGDLRPNDPGWNVHRDFYNKVFPYLNSNAILLIEEVEPFQSEVHIPITNDIPFDIRPNPPINDFIEMIEQGGLQYIDAAPFHVDQEEGIKMWLLISQKKA